VGHRDHDHGARRFTKGTNHFAHSGKPSDQARVTEYESGPYAGIADKALKGLQLARACGQDVSRPRSRNFDSLPSEVEVQGNP
jgi:hypothetical protein